MKRHWKFSATLKRAIEESPVPRTQLAAWAGVQLTRFSAWTHDLEPIPNTEFCHERVARLAGILGVDVEDALVRRTR